MMKKAIVLAAAAAIGLAVGATGVPTNSARATAVVQQAAPGDAVAVFAGGCFWGMEGMFEHVKGVKSVSPGYAGGSARDANYPAVSSETTRHAESVRIVYDPKQVSYADLLGVFFTVAHDPTQVNGQYPDEGTSYRSAIFPQNEMQRKVAAAYIASLNRSGAFAKPIATKLESGSFYPAEAEHQDFMRRHPNHPYIVQWDKPRLAKLARSWPKLYTN